MRRIAKSEQQQLELVVVGQVGALVDVSHRAGHAVAPLRLGMCGCGCCQGAIGGPAV